MVQPGTEDAPLRVAIIGAGPAGFYAAEHLFRHAGPRARVDLFDRLPTPYGLVRAGVAPDHQKIKNVIRVYEKTAKNAGFRFFGNVEFGVHVGLDDLRRFYHAIVFTTGAQVDRHLSIPGESLRRSHSATEFVAWYNGHPDYRSLEFDLGHPRAVVVGVGNVAIDVARILCKTPDELAGTDIADHALDALRRSRVEEVVILGRRGPAQAAFTNPEIREMGELADADVVVLPGEVILDPVSHDDLEAHPDRTTASKVELLQRFAETSPRGRSRRVVFRFLVSPVELLPAEDGGVGRVRIVRNELVRAADGSARPRATDRFEELEAGILFRSVGYKGVALPGVPFHDGWGVIRNVDGRVVDDSDRIVPGLYAAGWIKRGPSGVIGTNKACAVETVGRLLADLEEGRLSTPPSPSPDAAAAFVSSRQPRLFTFDDWKRLDALEVERGAGSGRPRVKFVSVGEMTEALAGVQPREISS